MFFCLSSYADELIKNKILINGIKIYKKANCANCHSWHGRGGRGGYGIGVSLRVANNDINQLTNIIKCGIPGSQMPYFFKHSYKNKKCYGMLLKDFSDKNKPKNIGIFLNKKQIAHLANFIYYEL